MKTNYFLITALSMMLMTSCAPAESTDSATVTTDSVVAPAAPVDTSVAVDTCNTVQTLPVETAK